MPPKRKRAEAAVPATTRSTRASTRSKGKTTAQNDSATSRSLSVASKDSDIDMEPPIKRTRKTAGKASKSTSTKGHKKKEPDDDLASNGKATESGSSRPIGQSSKPSASSKNTSGSKPEPYSPEQVSVLFSQYADEDNRDVIGPEGFERLCADTQIAMDGAAPLLLAWQLGATELAKIQRAEWVKGMDELRISSLNTLALALRELENLMLLGKPALKQSKPTGNKTSSDEPYNRSRYHRYVQSVAKAYSELYLFSFMLAKPETSRSIDIETASAIWSVLVAPKYPVMNNVLEFINEKGTYKGVNKDLWTMTLEFCQTVSPKLEGYDIDGAWPTMLDEFVNWQKQRTTTSYV